MTELRDPWCDSDQRHAGFRPGDFDFENLENVTNMNDTPPVPPIDDERNVYIGDPGHFVDQLRHYAKDKLSPDILDHKQTMFYQDDMEEDPEWMYLMGSCEKAHLEFWHWSDTIKHTLGCDAKSSKAFVSLFRKSPPEAPHGYMEACRVLAHMLKDKSKGNYDIEHVSGIDGKQDWSRFMEVACNEAIECLDDPAALRSLMPKVQGFKPNVWFNDSPQRPQRRGCSSSSSGTWQANKRRGKGCTDWWPCRWQSRLR